MKTTTFGKNEIADFNQLRALYRESWCWWLSIYAHWADQSGSQSEREAVLLVASPTSQSAEEGYQKDLVPTQIWTAEPWFMRPVW